MAFRYRFSLGLSSVDRAGVLFYPELFRHAHDAYEALMTDLGQPLSDWFEGDSHALPVVHAEADYHRPLHHGVAVEVGVHVLSVGRSSFTVRAAFFSGADQLCAEVTTVHVCVHRPSGIAAALPGEFRKRLQEAMP